MLGNFNCVIVENISFARSFAAATLARVFCFLSFVHSFVFCPTVVLSLLLGFNLLFAPSYLAFFVDLMLTLEPEMLVPMAVAVEAWPATLALLDLPLIPSITIFKPSHCFM